MTDSIAVLPPGWQANNSSGALITDGILAFFDAGTSNARTVYSDASLLTSLGTTVNCNSAGYPVSAGNSKVLIYTGASAYKIRLTSALVGGTVWEFDNVRGALDTSSFLTSATVADESVVATSTDLAVGLTYKGKLIDANCSGGSITMTIADAATLGDGWFVTIRHAGTANQVKIIGDGTDTFGLPGVTPTAFALTGLGECVRITCNGAAFKVTNVMAGLLSNTIGVIMIADRLSTPPGSPTAGARYILTSAPTGAWSTFAQHDIAEANGQGGWFKYTPATDCGWVAFVQDEDVNYQFRGSAWVSYAASDTVAGFIETAIQSEMEAGSSTTHAVTPGMQKFHPSAAKAWVEWDGSGSGTIGSSFGVSSVTDAANGNNTVNFSTAFSSASYSAAGMACFLAGGQPMFTVCGKTGGVGSDPTTTAFNVYTRSDANSASDTTWTSLITFGDL